MVYGTHIIILLGNCAEVLCSEESYSRQDQDDFAIESYERSNNAIKQGLFKNEITPIQIKTKNEITFDTDEEPLKFSKEKITKLRSFFERWNNYSCKC